MISECEFWYNRMSFTRRSVLFGDKKYYMIKRTSKILVPFALCAMGLVSFFITGCREEKKPSQTVVDPPSVYMKDPQFKNKLEEQRAKMRSLFERRSPIVDKMKLMIDEAKAKLKTEDVAKIEEALKKTPEWEKLRKELEEVNNLINATRMATTKIVGERIAPKKAVSK